MSTSLRSHLSVWSHSKKVASASALPRSTADKSQILTGSSPTSAPLLREYAQPRRPFYKLTVPSAPTVTKSLTLSSLAQSQSASISSSSKPEPQISARSRQLRSWVLPSSSSRAAMQTGSLSALDTMLTTNTTARSSRMIPLHSQIFLA
jgi:hypothetical protein